MLKLDNLKTFKTMKEDKSKPPKPIVSNGILLPKTILTIVGQAKIGKTFLIYDLALAIASGGSFLNAEVAEPKSVLILSAEGGYYPNRERVKVLSADIGDESLERIGYIPFASLDLGDVDHLYALIDMITQGGYQVIIIDPLIRFHTADENSSSAMSVVYSNLRHLIEETKVAVCLVHHTGKNKHAGPRGSSLITSEYDSCIMLTGDSKHAIAEFDMRHVLSPEPLVLSLNSETYRFDWYSKNHEDQVERLIEEEPMTRAEIASELKALGMSSSAAYRAISKTLQSKRYVISDGKITRIAAEVS
jgi:archaellum biogenesis ATPase FlaH